MLFIGRAARPDGVNQVDGLAFDGGERSQVMLPFGNLLLVIALEVRVVLPRDERGLEKRGAQAVIAALG